MTINYFMFKLLSIYFSIILMASCTPLSYTEISYSQVFIGNTTSIGPVFMDHLNPAGCNELKINNITSNTHGNKRDLINMIDNNRSTSFLERGLGTWFRLDLGQTRNLCYIEIAWKGGSSLVYNFSISIPANDSYYAKVVHHYNTSKSTIFPEVYDLNGVKSRYVDLYAFGNLKNNSTNIAEVKIYFNSNK
jgi:hypothetical protein